MKNTSERRQMILEYLLEHRETTRFELSNHFNVSLRTIERDILILSCSYPIITIQGGGGGICGGGVHEKLRRTSEADEAAAQCADGQHHPRHPDPDPQRR